MLLDQDLDGTRLAATVGDLAADPVRRRAMAGSARALARPDATTRIADLAEQLMTEKEIGESHVS